MRVVVAEDSGMRSMGRRVLGIEPLFAWSDGLFCYAEFEDVEGSGAEVEVLADGVGEVDEDVGAFGATEDEAVEPEGRRGGPDQCRFG